MKSLISEGLSIYQKHLKRGQGFVLLKWQLGGQHPSGVPCSESRLPFRLQQMKAQVAGSRILRRETHTKALPPSLA